MNKVYLETYGCQMNEYDTEIVKSVLRSCDFGLTEKMEKADVIFLNTCSVREHAHEKVYQRLHVIKQLRRKNKNLVIGVLGCMTQNLKEELLDNKIGIDILAGPDSYKNLPQIIEKVRNTGKSEFDLTLSEFETYSEIFPTPEKGVNAWIAVMRGCNNFCTFCVVPYTRGRERSRDPENIINEVKHLVDQDFVQVTLLGQNVNSYKYENYEFADLMEKVSKVGGLHRIRFTSPHPKDFPSKLIDVVTNNPKVCKHIHLPVQAGNDRILTKMNRTYTQAEYLDLVHLLKKRIPNLVLTTDFIVGFPTETEEEFQETLNLVKEVEFDAAFMFKYSERKQTVAKRRYKDDVSEEDKTSRITRLVDLQKEISLKKNREDLGKVTRVLVEGPAKKPDQLMGRNDGSKIVVFTDTGQKMGEFVDVKVEEVTANTLIGMIND